MQDFIDNTDVIFMGYVESKSNAYSSARYVRPNVLVRETTFRVLKGYKGVENSTIAIEAQTSQSSCGIEFEPNKIHVISANSRDNIFITGQCTNNFYEDSVLINYLETGKTFVSPTKETCFQNIKDAYENKLLTEKLSIDPFCIGYKEWYDGTFQHNFE